MRESAGKPTHGPITLEEWQRAILRSQHERALRSDGTADHFGDTEHQLDTERRCRFRFFTRTPCLNPPVDGATGRWWCAEHVPNANRRHDA